MKELLASLGKFLLEALKQVDYKKVLYLACKNTFLPYLKALSLKTESKVDDVIYNGLERMVEVFLAPETKPLPLPVQPQ